MELSYLMQVYTLSECYSTYKDHKEGTEEYRLINTAKTDT